MLKPVKRKKILKLATRSKKTYVHCKKGKNYSRLLNRKMQVIRQ